MAFQSKSGKTLAMVTATVVLQCAADADDADVSRYTPQQFEHALEQTILHTSNNATEPRRLKSGRFEMSCKVQYGPVFGAYESDIRRAAKAVVQDGDEVEVFDCQRKELAIEDVDELRGALVNVESLAERKRIAGILAVIERKAVA